MSQPDALYEQFRRAEVLFDFGHPGQAAEALAPVVEAEPGHAAALELYARALLGSAQLRRAEAALRDLVELRPDDGWAHLALARSLERQGRQAEAEPVRRLARALGQPEA